MDLICISHRIYYFYFAVLVLLGTIAIIIVPNSKLLSTGYVQIENMPLNVEDKILKYFDAPSEPVSDGNDYYIKSCFYYDYYLSNHSFDKDTKCCAAKYFDVLIKDIDDNVFNINEWIKITIISYDENRLKCLYGGNSFAVYLENMQNTDNALVYYLGNEQFNVVDMLNGEYSLSIWLGLDSNITYNLIIKHNFQCFKHVFNCNTRRDRYIKLLTIYNKTIFVTKNNQSNALNTLKSIQQFNVNNIGALYWNNMIDKQSKYITKYSVPTGRWIRYQAASNAFESNQSQQLVETLLNELLDPLHKNIYFRLYQQDNNTQLQLFPINKIHNKWIHFHGKSKTQRLFDEFSKIINIYCQNKNLHKSPHQYFELPGDHFAPSGRINYLQVVNFLEFNILLTFMSHDEIKFVNYNWTELFLQNITNRFTRQKLPDILIMNKGLHVIDRMFEYDIMDEFVTYLHRLFESIIDYYDDNVDPIYMYWIRTSPTHFFRNKLWPRWMCRTSDRINCLNIITDTVLYKYYDKLNNKNIIFNVFNEYEMGLGRYDCTPDNRHYSKSNCKQNVVNVLLNHIDTVLF